MVKIERLEALVCEDTVSAVRNLSVSWLCDANGRYKRTYAGLGCVQNNLESVLVYPTTCISPLQIKVQCLTPAANPPVTVNRPMFRVALYTDNACQKRGLVAYSGGDFCGFSSVAGFIKFVVSANLSM